MDMEEIDDVGGGTSDESADRSDETTSEESQAPRSGPTLNRRRFLTAAALGTAAAALFNKGGSDGTLRIGPGIVMADVLTNVNCTANDVRIIGPGIVVNEPCTCNGTFDAKVRFTINNNTGTQRYCVTVHLCPGLDENGQEVVAARDIVIGTIDPGQREYEVTIPGYPCGAGNVCFGAAGSGEDGGFAKGETCPTGKCCTVISWNVRPNDGCPQPHGDIIKSKCRAQQVCIQSFGISATCADSSCAARSLTNGCCTVPCGGSLNVKVTASGQSAGTPCTSLTISVKRPGDMSFTNVTLNSSGCYVDSSPVQGTYTFRATDCHGCFRETTLAVCVQTIATPTLTKGTTNCSGVTTFTVSPCPPASGVSYTLQQVDCTTGDPVATPTITNVSYNAITCTFTATLPQGQTTCVRVKASNGNADCDVFSSAVSVAVPAALAIAAPIQSDNLCSGIVTFNPGAVSGGAGPFTYAFSFDNGAFVTGATYVYHPTLVNGGLDTSCHSLKVRVTDANGCTATSPAKTFSQCISTTTGCTP
jgi:hypothetical protein